MKKLYMLIMIGLTVAAAQAVVIDDFEDGDMAEYVQTVILDGSPPPQIVWTASSGTVWATIQTYDGIEQGVALRDDYSLAVGDTLKIDTTGHVDGSQDLGLVVAVTKTPTYQERVDYVNVYMRADDEVYSRGFDGTTEFPLAGGGTPDPVDALFIERVATNQFSTGYYIGSTKTVITTRTVDNTNIGTAIGLYTDMRSANTHGGLDNLEIISAPQPATVITDPNDRTLVQTGNAIFETVFASNSTPSVDWYKVDVSGDIFMDPLESNIDVQLTYEPASEQYTSTLTLSNTVVANSGQYYCQINNDSGVPVNSQTANLMIYGLVAYWTLDQSRYDAGNYLEEIGGYDAAAAGTPTFVAGVDGAVNGATQISATDGWALCPVFDLVRQSGKMTISFWVNWSEIQTTEQDLQAESTDDEVLTMTNGLKADGQWQHLCMVFDGATGKLYVDGVLRDETAWQLPTETQAAINIGIDMNQLNPFNGAMDDVRLYNYALNEYDVADLRYGLSGEGSCIPGFADQYDITGPEGLPDCAVNVWDLTALAEDFLESGSPLDLTGPAEMPDGIVDFYEFADLASSWLSCGLYPACN